MQVDLHHGPKEKRRQRHCNGKFGQRIAARRSQQAGPAGNVAERHNPKNERDRLAQLEHDLRVT